MGRNKLLSTTVGIVVTVTLLAFAMLMRPAHCSTTTPASATEVASSLTHGVAWIWPDSNGPKRGDAVSYPEAAVLIESLMLRNGIAQHGGRTSSLNLPTDVRILPVIHVEVGEDEPAQFTEAQITAVLAAVRRQAGVAASGAGWLQLDFEAPARQREAYRALVTSIRQALPASVRLSVTALAHWCTQGNWLDQLPVDEVVPMLYRLGPHAGHWRDLFTKDSSSLAQRCRGSALGFATNDPPSLELLQRTPRPYWFDETAWSNPSHPPRYITP